MTHLFETFASLLADVQRPGGFHVAGAFDLHPPRLEVEGVGSIALPLVPEQAQALIALADQAPYGRGAETLVNTQVRRTWQVDAARVRLTGRHWSADLAAVVERVRQGLGIAGSIEAEIYKLLIYDEGSFFVAHRDTEKAPGMFGTLVVVLPGDYSGGELIIRHRGEEVRVDLHRDEPAEAAFAAFYADCVHEVTPIAAGYRLALIYNLRRTGSGTLPQAPDYQAVQDHLTRLLASWPGLDELPDKLVYPLEHAYTEAEIAFATLKGRDAAAAQVLIPAAAAADCELHLALISISESGWAEYTGGGRRNAPELEIGEVTDSEWSIHDWRRPDDGPAMTEPLPFSADEVAPSDMLDTLAAVEPEFSEATGNEGASFERFYQSAALILWPRTRYVSVLAGAGFRVSIGALSALTHDWEAAGGQVEAATRRLALDLAAAIGVRWRNAIKDWRYAISGSALHELLDAQRRLGDLEGCAASLDTHATANAYEEQDNPALVSAFAALPPEQAAAHLCRFVANQSVRRPGACANLLRRLAAQDPARRNALAPPLEALLAGLPDGIQTAAVPYRDRTPPLAPAQLTDALLASAAAGVTEGEPSLGERLVTRLLALPAVYDRDALLLPAALQLASGAAELGLAVDPEPPAWATLRAALLAHLDARLAEPLAPPTDWTRTAVLPCQCSNCQSLSRFLAAADDSRWHFKASEADRSHLAQVIERAGCDLALATDKRGRPYTLVCTKNQASFERRMRQRTQDLLHREQLAR